MFGSHQGSLISNTNHQFMNMGSNTFRSYEEIQIFSHKNTKKTDAINKHKSTQNLHSGMDVSNSPSFVFDEKAFFNFSYQREISQEDVAPEWFARKYKSFMPLTKEAPRRITNQGFDLIRTMDSFVMKLLNWQLKSKHESVFITKMFLCILDCFKGFPIKFSKTVWDYF